MTVCKIPKKFDPNAPRHSIFEMVRGTRRLVDYSKRVIPKGMVNYFDRTVDSWDVVHTPECLPVSGQAHVHFDFLKFVPDTDWGVAYNVIKQIHFRPVISAEQEALRTAPVSYFDGVLVMLNSFDSVRAMFPRGIPAFAMAGTGTFVVSKDGVKLHPYVEVDSARDARGVSKKEENRNIQMRTALEQMRIPPLTVIPVVHCPELGEATLRAAG